jgi:hypothetical protein
MKSVEPPDPPVPLRLYWCGDCEAWSSLACHDSEHHLRSFKSVPFVPAVSSLEGGEHA